MEGDRLGHGELLAVQRAVQLLDPGLEALQVAGQCRGVFGEDGGRLGLQGAQALGDLIGEQAHGLKVVPDVLVEGAVGRVLFGGFAGVLVRASGFVRMFVGCAFLAFRDRRGVHGVDEGGVRKLQVLGQDVHERVVSTAVGHDQLRLG